MIGLWKREREIRTPRIWMDWDFWASWGLENWDFGGGAFGNRGRANQMVSLLSWAFSVI